MYHCVKTYTHHYNYTREPVDLDDPRFSHCLQKGMHFPNSPAHLVLSVIKWMTQHLPNTLALRQYDPNIRNPWSGVVTENNTRKTRRNMDPDGNSVMKNLKEWEEVTNIRASYPKIHGKPMEMKIEMYTRNSFLLSLLLSAWGALRSVSDQILDSQCNQIYRGSLWQWKRRSRYLPKWWSTLAVSGQACWD